MKDGEVLNVTKADTFLLQYNKLFHSLMKAIAYVRAVETVND